VVGAALALAALAWILVVEAALPWVVAILALLFAAAAAARFALRRDASTLRIEAASALPVPAVARPVLIMNPRSGGGKVERFDLVAECRRRGIEPVVLRPGDDLRQLAQAAVARGADAVGMA